MQVIDLVRYNHVVRSNYFYALAKLPWIKIIEPQDLSFDSMRNVFVHLTLVEDRWIGYIIPGRFKEWVDIDFDSFDSIDALKEYMQRVRGNSDIYIEKLSLEELKRQIVIPWGERPDTKITVETALSHMVLEDMIHYGELSAVLWQMGLEAPYLGFWRYKYMHA
jgi:uncharacterized damage-inducible protein DinB